MRYGIVFLWALAFLLADCKVKKKAKHPVTATATEIQVTPNLQKNSEGKVYHPAQTRFFDLIHTKLEVAFSYEKEEVYGKASLLLRPYFYPSSKLVLDARGFELKEVSLIRPDGKRDSLHYTYDDALLIINLDKKYSSTETFNIYIDYIARPGLLKAAGSSAITDARGLYFINPQLNEPGKPRQIWSQGETQSSSCWFPTIDSPNEKMTQEIYLTVQADELTLSNGELVYSSFNKDGTRTDCWKQELPHSTYLVMIAVGKFAIVKDYWRDSVEVNYYVEPEYKPYAKQIFGNTPEMMEFFSKKLGVDYPWKKFSQVVVRDFVSGAMENTTAVVHGEFLQQDARGLLDETNEDVVSHELFHHWFGDLVTCESWANLPLNESFATYGEYLWREYKYGRDDADAHLAHDITQYLYDDFTESKKMIRYYYKNQEDMFDGHSYQKGALILHMLRGYVGDNAFFNALRLYLNKRKFNTAEIHDLRMAFEEVTGEDLNWFFNQWFFGKGHPELDLDYRWNGSSGQMEITIDQTQDTILRSLFRLPMEIAFYDEAGEMQKEKVWMEEQKNVYRIKLAKEPALVIFDPGNYVLAVKNEFRSRSDWAKVYGRFDNYRLRSYAFNQLMFGWLGDSLQMDIAGKALRDKLWTIRLAATNVLSGAEPKQVAQFESLLKEIAFSDPKAGVRAGALSCLRKLNTRENYKFFLAAANDSSYKVVSVALDIISDYSADTAVLLAELNKETRSSYLRGTVSEILAKKGKGDYQSFFELAYSRQDWGTFFQYGAYICRLKDDQLNRAIQFLSDKNRALHLSGDELKRSMLHAAALQLNTRMKEVIATNQAEAEKLKKTDATRLIYEEEARKAEEIRLKIKPILIPD